MVMIIVMENVNIAALKARLSHFLRRVRRGGVVNVLDRDTPIARIVPYEDAGDLLPSRVPRRKLSDVRLPRTTRRDLGSLDVLLEERRAER
jgi:prevent-host-death family protein